MRTITAVGTISLCVAAALGSVARANDLVIDREASLTFATLPDGVRFPEGITANPATGEIFVGTFDFGPNANQLLRYSPAGQLVARRGFGATPLLGLAFDSAQQKVYVANFGASAIQRLDAAFGPATAIETIATIPGIGAPPNATVPNPDGSSDTIIFGSNSFPAPNAMAFDRFGNLYVSDSFQGAIFRIDNARGCTPPCAVTTVIHHPLLATVGFPPFGANGVALNADESALFVANTGDDRVLKLDLATNALTVFAESVNGADGVAFDDRGRLWVAANQADEVIALNADGRVVARLGEFRGIRFGAPVGLLFPASPVIVGGKLYVTNLSIALTPALGDEPEEDVARFTVSRMAVPNN